MQEKIIEEIHSVIITLLDNKDQTVKFDRIVKLCQLINNLKKMFPKKMLKEYLEFIDSMEIFLENCSNENFLNENQEILLSSLELLSECINEIKKYFENEGASCPDIQIKWPNDLVVNGKKLAGILTEMSTQIDYINYVTVGIGINANTKKFPEELKDHATSLYLECGHMVKRASVIASIMKCFEEDYRLFLETEDLSGLMETYMSMLVNRDRDVLVLDPSGTYKAKALGIDKNGELIVRREDGTSEHVYAGEVSVRGVYGYV